MIKTIFLVGLGGFLGSIARYSLGLGILKLFPLSFPLGTFLVNVLGCLFMGILFGMMEKHNFLSEYIRIFLIIGFCGGFTTFSTFAFENISLLQNSNYLGFILYSSGSFILGLLAVWTGLTLTKI